MSDRDYRSQNMGREARDHAESSSRRGSDDRSSRQKKSRELDNELSRPREREHRREYDKRKDQDHHRRNYRDRNSRDERRDYGGRDYERPRDRERRRRSRSRSSSPSDSKSKRASGFDMAPPAAALLPNAPVPDQLPGVHQPIPGLMQNMFPVVPAQLGPLSLMPAQAMTQQATRHARRVYVGGLPPSANEQTIATFFSQVMTAIGGNAAGPGDAVVNVYINHEKKFAFVEMRSVEEASNAMALDGISFEAIFFDFSPKKFMSTAPLALLNLNMHGWT